jgi:cytochrome c oxidase subunit 4
MAHAAKVETRHEDVAIHGNKFYYVTWGWLLALTAVEVFLAYEQLSLHLMIVLLMGLSIVKAGFIMSNFMHLRFEKKSLVLTLIPAMVIAIALLSVFFPDSFRLLDLRVQ